MIVINTSGPCVEVTVLGEFNLADYREFEETVNYKIRFEGEVDLLFDVRSLYDRTIDMLIEEIKFSRAHRHSFRRMAVVTESQWVTWATWLGNIFAEADLRAFADLEEAKKWLALPVTEE